VKEHVITVVGAGNGGCAIAANLSLKGHHVRLLKTSNTMHQENFETIVKQGGIFISHGSEEEFAPLEVITRDYELAMSGSEIIYVVTQTVAHDTLAPKLAPYFKSGMIVLISPGYGGSLIFSKHTTVSDVIFSEAQSLPLDCRIYEPGKVNILYENVRNPLGFFPSEKTDYALIVLKDLFLNFVKLDNIIEAALHNPNLIVHTVGAVMNVARIEYSNGEFWMYREGFTPSIWNLLLKLDAEKMDILEKLNLKRIPYLEFIKVRNSINLDVDGMDVFRSYADEGSPKGPSNSKNRYITEDVPIGLGLMHSLGKKVGIKTPVCDSLIEISSAIHNVNYWEQIRSLDKLGVDTVTVDEFNTYLRNGTYLLSEDTEL